MKSDNTSIKKPYRILNAFFDCILAAAFMYILTMALSTVTSQPGGEIMMQIETAGIISFLSFTLVLLLRRKHLRFNLHRLFAAPGPSGQISFLIFITAAGLGIVLSQIDNLLRPMLNNEIYYDIIDYIYSDPGFLTILIIGVLAPFIEELFFRGYIYRRLRSSLSKPAAIIAASLLFGIFHLNTPQMIAGFFTGLILCYLTEAAGGILYAVLFHITFNTLPLLLIAMEVNVKGYTVSGAGINQPVWFTILGFLLTAAGVLVLSHSLNTISVGKRQEEDKADVEKGEGEGE